NCTFYAATGHRLCFGFRAYWQSHGGLAIFGYPLSEELSENGYTVQYFERARFEYHPANPPQYQIQLGLLGTNAAIRANLVGSTLVQQSNGVTIDCQPAPPDQYLPCTAREPQGAQMTFYLYL